MRSLVEGRSIGQKPGWANGALPRGDTASYFPRNGLGFACKPYPDQPGRSSRIEPGTFTFSEADLASNAPLRPQSLFSLKIVLDLFFS